MNELSTSSDRGSTLYVSWICLVAALGGLLFGYDTAVIADAIGYLEARFLLTATMKGWASSCVLIGCMIGVSFAGVFSDWLGRKKTLMLAGLLFLVSSLGTALPNALWQFVVFRMLAGMGVGIASMASPMYISEIAPARIRGRLVSVNQFAIVGGMLVTYFVNYFIAGHSTLAGDPTAPWHHLLRIIDSAQNSLQFASNTTSGWRWMFGLGVAPSILFLLLLTLAPESPRWLIKQGCTDAALRVLRRVNGPETARKELEAIRDTIAHEGGSISQLLQPGWRQALGIGIALAVLQQVTGINVFLYFAPEIFKQLGSGTNAALLQTVVVGAVNLLFTIVAIWTVDRLGRKPLMIVGAAGMGLCLLAIGLAAQFNQTGSLAMIVLSFILGYIACFALSVGPVTWVILSEIFPTRIRGRAMSIATLCLWFADFVVTQTFPMMDAADSWLVRQFNHAFPFYLYAVFCVVLVLVLIRWVPETKGQSLEEIEHFWSAGSPTQAQSKTHL